MSVPIYFFSFSRTCNAFCLVYVLLFMVQLMIRGLCIQMVKIFAFGQLAGRFLFRDAGWNKSRASSNRYIPNIHLKIVSFEQNCQAVALGKLNFHRFKHNFKDTTSPICPTNNCIEDTEHFLLLCPCIDLPR